MIRNTTADMQDPNGADALLMLATAMTTGSPGEFIAAQEKSGQAQLVNSDRLPTDTGDTDEKFLAVGFTFGEPEQADPLFRPATLPAGWSRARTDHSMWSQIVDEIGRKRVGIFYKAAYYDRRADMYLNTVYGYVSDRVYEGEPVVSDDAWATPDAIAEAANVGIERAQESLDLHSPRKDSEYSVERVAKSTAEIAAYQALIAQFGPDSPAK